MVLLWPLHCFIFLLLHLLSSSSVYQNLHPFIPVGEVESKESKNLIIQQGRIHGEISRVLLGRGMDANLLWLKLKTPKLITDSIKC